MLPIEYITQKFYQYAGFVKYKPGTHSYNGCCPSCREGTSWAKKKRLNYLPDRNIIHCFNCTRTWSPLNWIIESSGMTYQEVMDEASEYDFSPNELQEEKAFRPESSTLPFDSINLFDDQQVKYFIKNQVVLDALEFIRKRRIDSAINRPNALYISLKDFVHKNRLVIPFCDFRGKILWYQTRAIYKKDEQDRPKYMSKMNSEKSVFGLNKINEQLDYLFIFEGPLDSIFVQNGLSMAGLNMTSTQEEQMKRYSLYNKIWVLDNDMRTNKNVKDQAIRLLDRGERVFIWPDKFNGIKDLNELCVKVGKDSVKPEFFIDNSYEGSEGLNKLALLK
jgi:hypothetical protein